MTLHTGKAYRNESVSIEAHNLEEIGAAVISDGALTDVDHKGWPTPANAASRKMDPK